MKTVLTEHYLIIETPLLYIFDAYMSIFGGNSDSGALEIESNRLNSDGRNACVPDRVSGFKTQREFAIMYVTGGFPSLSLF